MINNEVIKTCDRENGCRGLNVVAADAFTHKVLFAKSYDTFASDKAADALLKDLTATPEGTVLLVSVRDEASRRLNSNVKKFFSKMGSSAINTLAHRHSWAFIGVRGQEAFTEETNVNEPVGTGAILGYAKTVKKYKKVTKITGGSKIEVHSAGYINGNVARVLVNEKEVLSNKESSRGINVAILDFETHKVVFKATYDTMGDGRATQKLLSDFKEKVP